MNYDKKANSIYTNSFIDIDGELISLEKYKKYDEFFECIVSSAKNLSNFEKYIYAYNITKHFKEYKESKNNKLQARSLYNILENDYIVCRGFVNLFKILLEKLGIKSVELSLVVDTALENNCNINEEYKEYHVRTLTRIIDKKYNIDGIYISDPTWDNDLENDYYNHLAMTPLQSLFSERFIYFNNDFNELFYVSSMSEFYTKLYIIINRGKKHLKSEISNLLDKIKDLDNEFYELLKVKYNYIDELYFLWPQDINPLISDIGNYIINNTKNNISNDTVMRAVEEIYKQYYGYKEEDLDNVLNNVRNINKIRDNKYFIKKKKIDIK